MRLIAPLRGSHDLSVQRAQRTKSSRREGIKPRSRAPEGPQTSSTVYCTYIPPPQDPIHLAAVRYSLLADTEGVNIHHTGVKHHNMMKMTIKLKERKNIYVWSDEVDHGCRAHNILDALHDSQQGK